jgi:hypothetical protein
VSPPVRVTEPGTFLYYDNKLAEVVGIADGKVLILRFVSEPACEHCGRRGDLHVMEQAPQFQDHVKPVRTITT